MSYLVCLLFIMLYYGICIFALVCDGGIKVLGNVGRKLTPMRAIASIFALVGSLVLTIYWIKQDHFIYYWDYAGYWITSIDRMDFIFSSDAKSIVETLMSSINNDDYNVFLPTIVALPMKLLGYSYLRYVFINHVMFLLPAVFVQALCVEKLMQRNAAASRPVFEMALCMAVLFPANYVAMYRGYIDVAILLPISILLYLLIDLDFKRVSISRGIALALEFILLWISRRYSIYFIIGFVAALIVKALAEFFMQREKRIFIKILQNFLLIGGVSLGLLLLLFRDFVLHALLTNYGEMYSAYDAPLSSKMAALTSSFGYITFAIVIVSGIFCFYYKRHRVNFLSLLVLLLVETLLFWNTQDMGVHHRMI